MIRKLKNIFLVVLLILLNLFFIIRILRFTSIYPFERVELNNQLLHRLSADDNLNFKTEIISIENEKINDNKLYSILEKNKNKETLAITYKQKGQILSKTISKGNNKDILWLFLILLLIADIHYLWGFLLRMSRSNISLAKLFYNVAMGLSLLFFSLIEFFSYNEFKIFYHIFIFYAGYMMLRIGFNLTDKKINRKIKYIYLITILIISFFSFAGTSSETINRSYCLLFTLLILSSIYTLGNLIYDMMKSNIYVIKRNLVIIASILIGFTLPTSFLAAGFIYDLNISLHYSQVLSIIIPVIIGNAILQYKIFNLKIILETRAVFFTLNIIIAVIIAVFLYYITILSKDIYELSAYFSIVIVLTASLLHLRRVLKKNFSNVLIVNKDEYAFSIQNIAELVSSPEDSSKKIIKIFNEILKLIDINFIKIVLFKDSINDDYSDLSEYVEEFRKDSILYDFIVNHREVIFRHSLIKNTFLEEWAHDFCARREIFIILPVIMEKEISGALLVGDKNGDKAFTDTDVEYLETISFQLYQLLENDRLFKNYLTRSSYEKELDIASYIQLRLFPKIAPENKGLAISFYNRPYMKVTGDYFDFIDIDKNRTAVIIGDVSGHGLPAAMILSMTSSITNAMLREKKSIEKTLEEINHFLNFRYTGKELITLFIGIYNKVTRELVYINAGHCPPILINPSRKKIDTLQGRSKILGADSSADYAVSKLILEKDQELIFYTDGVIELYNEKTDEQFCENDLVNTLLININNDIEGKINAIVKDINRFDIESNKDDITLIGVKIL